jgi:hypothetical protein
VAETVTVAAVDQPVIIIAVDVGLDELLVDEVVLVEEVALVDEVVLVGEVELLELELEDAVAVVLLDIADDFYCHKVLGNSTPTTDSQLGTFIPRIC